MGFCRKINILYVITKLELGGAQKQLLSIVRHLDKEKFNPYLITASHGLLVEEASRIEGLTLIRCGFLERPIHPLKDILAFFFIYGFIKNNGIDVVHTHSSKAGILGRLAARVAGARLIIHTVHGWSFHNYQARPFYYLYLLLERLCASFSSAIIVVSRFDQKLAESLSIGRREQYRLIRYAVESARSRPAGCPGKLNGEFCLSGDGPFVGMVSCFKPQKAPVDFIKLAGALKDDFPDVRFILVGDGILRDKVVSLVNKLGLKGRVILTGWRRDVPEILSCLDVFVLTSLWEGLPIVVLEALAAGVPVLATDTGGIREIVSEGVNGYLVKPHDIYGMQKRLRELLSRPSLRAELSCSAGRYAEAGEYTSDTMLDKTVRLYSDLYSGDEHA
jgi:glycosyltransferase involved in cell wall biosynthesis